jgi:hypothetical protein
MWLEYAELSKDEVDVYYYMLNNSIYNNENIIADRIVDYYCKRDDYEKANLIPEILSNINVFKDENKLRFYEKLKLTIETKILEYMNSTILFPEIIQRYLNKNLNDSLQKEHKIQSSNEKKGNQFYIKVRNSEENLRESSFEVNQLIKKFHLLKSFLTKYDENFKLKDEAKVTQLFNQNNKPFSFLNPNRFPPVLPVPVITTILSNLNITYYYNNAINSFQSSLVKLALDKTRNLPTECKLLHLTTDNIDKTLFDYLFKINTLVYVKYERECFLTKITFMKFINGNNNVRTYNINYAVKNLVYLHGIGDSYIGIFTPFYFILFDVNKISNFLIRFRFEVIQNQFTEESPIIYLYEFNKKCVAYSIFNNVYVIQIDPNRDTIILKNKFEGHKREITKLTFKKLETAPILISASKNQIIMWNLDNTNLFKIIAIDDQFVVNDLLLIRINVLCILTVYNQMYILEFGDGNNIKNIKMINFEDEQRIYKVVNDENFVFKIDNNSLSLYNYESERKLITFKDELFVKYDLIFMHNDNLIKKLNNKGKVAIFTLV